ncbi:ISNCY family transposase [Saccharolobus shibatae]|uniref:ISNCY family transposase n=1 Tax=Saccharolobus shibatae TaxID=2286 RepID=UPI0021BC24E6|nr:ISNCY family transposase [Saccharolobus shibatae]
MYYEHVNKKLTQKDFDDFKESIEDLIKLYKESRLSKMENAEESEEERLARLRRFGQELRKDIDEAGKFVKIKEEQGRKSKLTPQEKAYILIIKEYLGLSNRETAELASLLNLTKEEISYKTVERLYSDPDVFVILYNLLSKTVGGLKVDAVMDGTGYSLVVTKHYRSEREKSGEGVKEGRDFVYSFFIFDLGSNLIVAYGYSLKSEREAYEMALEVLRDLGVEVDSLRADKYYGKSTLDDFPDSEVYLIPKSNATIKGGKRWREMVLRFMRNPLEYLEEYFKRERAESLISSIKRHYMLRL